MAVFRLEGDDPDIGNRVHLAQEAIAGALGKGLLLEDTCGFVIIADETDPIRYYDGDGFTKRFGDPSEKPHIYKTIFGARKSARAFNHTKHERYKAAIGLHSEAKVAFWLHDDK